VGAGRASDTVIRARVDVTTNFGAITEAVNDLSRRAVSAGAQEGARVAGQIAATRKDTGLMAQMEVLPVRGSPDGWESSFRSRAPWRIFQDLGTLQGRGTKLKASTLARRASPSGQARLARVGDSPGIEPLHFYRAGRRAGRRAMLEVINRGL
jgi:hypothetical protein